LGSQLTILGLFIQFSSAFFIWKTIKITDREARDIAVGGYWEGNFHIYGTRAALIKAVLLKQYYSAVGLFFLSIGIIVQMVATSSLFGTLYLKNYTFIPLVFIAVVIIFVLEKWVVGYSYKKRIFGRLENQIQVWVNNSMIPKEDDKSELIIELKYLLKDFMSESKVVDEFEKRMKKI